jgi:nucleoside-diphosphate-sugar epimerase
VREKDRGEGESLNILIIGGTGLISTAITRQLLERGGATVCHYNRGQRAGDAFAGQVRTVHGDRYDRGRFVRQMQELQAEAAFDVVIEMIGYKVADVEDLSEAFAGRIGQLVYCSTVDVYSKPPARYPIREDASQETPAPWDYAQNKAKCEASLRAAHERGDFPVTVLRPAHTYSDTGTLQHSLGGSTTYLDRLRKGKPIIVHGDGQSLWVSCHAEDVARAFVNACGNAATFGKGYTLPGEEWLTWNDIHRTVAHAIGAPEPTLIHIPTELLARVTDRAFIDLVNFQYNNIFDTTAARTDLGFQYTIPFAEGARRVYETLDASGRIADSDADPTDDRIIAAWERLSEAMIDAMKG